MLNQRSNQLASDQDNSAPLWSQNQSIAFECAKEVMNDMISICSALLASEKHQKSPCQARISALNQERIRLLKERDAIHWYENEKIEQIRRKYGAKVRAYRTSGISPV